MRSVYKVVTSLLPFLGLLMWLGSGVAMTGPEVAAEEADVAAFIEAVPMGLTAGVGEVQTVYVTVLDKDRRPVPDVLVTASSDTPNRASVEPAEMRTDANGKARFTVRGVAYFSGSRAILTFRAGDLVATVETSQQWL